MGPPVVPHQVVGSPQGDHPSQAGQVIPLVAHQAGHQADPVAQVPFKTILQTNYYLVISNYILELCMD